MSENTGGQAFPGPHWSEGETGMTLLDWMAGQALAGLCANPGGPIQANGSTGWGFTNCDQQYVAGLSYDFASTMLAEKARREADHSVDANKMVSDHSPDAGKMVELQASNRELVEALEACEAAFSKFAPQEESAYGMAWVKVRAILAKHKETKP